jgi:16S rRNA (cytosine967-C5)-methyltransferase
MTGATKQRVCAELALPGPIRPRSIPDAVVDEVLSKEVVLPLPLDPVERAATVHSFPTWLAQSLARVAPDGELDAIFGALNREPFLSFVVRPPAVREDVARALKAQGISVQISEKVPNAMTLVDEGRAIFETRWVKEGHLVVMDLGSQQLAQLCRVLAGQTVIDVCAGAGGKTIVLADAVGPNGRVYAHDTSAKRLSEAKRRVAELRLRHVSFPKEPRYDLADVVLVDAPCSGTGTLAREPDQKWKLTPQRVAELVKTQRSILDEVVTRVRPGTVLVYGTCSLLHEENEAVVEAFLQEHREVQLMEAPLRVWPHRLEGGGFFGARLLKT